MMDTVDIMIVGGSETTATALSGATYLLATNKDVFMKLAQEVRSRFNHEDEIDLLSVQKLDYTMAVVQESMRVYPPVPAAMPRKAPPEGYTLRDGRHIPPNVRQQCPPRPWEFELTTMRPSSHCGNGRYSTILRSSRTLNLLFPKGGLMTMVSSMIRRKLSSHFPQVHAIASAKSWFSASFDRADGTNSSVS